ncbi:MAG: phytanoyl-CoA dioxygenase family protein, partial [Gammaproteobacteria bacterium]|nr:phytanoyl-CoA dioxygenase family protein [Gammaproteobacteria bacterium]
MNSNLKTNPQAAGPLTPEQIAGFQADGFVIVPGLFSAAEMEQVAAWADEVHGWPETPGRHMMYFEESRVHPAERILNRIENVLPYHDGFRALAVGPKMQGACGQLFDEPAVLFKDKINFKLPGGGGFEAHQDVQAGWARYADLHITVLITIDKTTLANGCLEMAKGFHDRGLIGTEWTPLTENDLRDAEFIAVESEPGDAVFFDSFAPHRSGPNNTDAPRRVLYYTYNKASQGDSLEQY